MAIRGQGRRREKALVAFVLLFAAWAGQVIGNSPEETGEYPITAVCVAVTPAGT
jgi:hypothetical protein